MTLRLLTFNALFKGHVRERLRALGEILETSDHDVVCLQEVMYRADVRLLRDAAPSYRHRVCRGPVVLQGGLVVLSRLPVTGSRFVRFPMTGPVRPEFLMRKGALIVTVQSGGTSVDVVNTHLSANRDDDWSAENRYTRVARAELAVVSGEISGPTVVTGDLNLPRGSAPLTDFIHRNGLHDLMAGDSRPTYRPTAAWPDPPAFDHILASDGITGTADLVLREETTAAGDFLSDHFGVRAELSLSR
ncbi:endonuclease/exonuclease/phosphatase family protein [Actinoplanes sp. NPDC051851]|uniref:endonuclease/exonuclease/phosphatase family protein n=1 Tax=Actinoplanes sp. NPDC051851 TaxID=3154753 RepID=UPI00342ED45A